MLSDSLYLLEYGTLMLCITDQLWEERQYKQLHNSCNFICLEPLHLQLNNDD